MFLSSLSYLSIQLYHTFLLPKFLLNMNFQNYLLYSFLSQTIISFLVAYNFNFHMMHTKGQLIYPLLQVFFVFRHQQCNLQTVVLFTIYWPLPAHRFSSWFPTPSVILLIPPCINKPNSLNDLRDPYLTPACIWPFPHNSPFTFIQLQYWHRKNTFISG